MSQPTTTPTDRRARPRPTAHACRADRCQQGRCACPVPQACELPEDTPATPLELTTFVLSVLAAAVLVLALVVLGGGA